MFTDNYDSSFCFSVFEKRLTQKNCFPFCKKYGLFNSSIFLTVNKILLSNFPDFHGQRSGGQDLGISYQAAMKRVRSKKLYTNSFTRNEL